MEKDHEPEAKDRGTATLADVTRLERASTASSRVSFVRGRHHPIGIAWFGLRSFWGHIRHFLASGIATEDIDSRDWMHADEPAKLVRRVIRHLGGDAAKPTLTEGLGRDVWIDFLADTGDDVDLSEAVARLFAARYEVPDPERPGATMIAPRGDVLLHGGDIAYPVATAPEIHDRVILPWNRVLLPRADGEPRVMLGVPGNHDWYDGLDGFARMFRRRQGELAPTSDPYPDASQRDRRTQLEHAVTWAEKFVSGGVVNKRKTLVVHGYEPMQHASYFVLPLSPALHLWGVDRQLRQIDFRQRRYFAAWREEHPEPTRFVLLPDPVRAFLEPSPTGVRMVRDLELDLHHEPHFVLAGDIHHYERWRSGKSTHVVAGGGGAFLHPPRIARRGFPKPAVEWPTWRWARRALWLVPLHVAVGRAGFFPHVLCALFFAPALGIGLSFGMGPASVDVAAVAASIFGTVVCAFVGGWRKGRFLRITTLASITGIAMGLVPTLATDALRLGLSFAGVRLGPTLHAIATLLLASFSGAFLFGTYLAVLTLLGLESSQAFTALSHPGFKHFVRLRVRRDGRAMDAFCIGLRDPLAKGERPVLVDAFTFHADGTVDDLDEDAGEPSA